MRTKLVAVAAAAMALVAGPLGAAPASAQPAIAIRDLPCEIFADPWAYPCYTAQDALDFALREVGDALVFAEGVKDEAAQAIFRVYCTVFPDQPQCW